MAQAGSHLRQGRQPGLPRALHRASEDQHVVQFYDDEGYLAQLVSDFVGSGLGEGEPALIIATRAHRDAFASALAARGFDLTVAQQEGQLTLLDATATLATFMHNGSPDPEKFHATISAAIERARGVSRSVRVRAYGEMVDLLWQQGNAQAALELEELWNKLRADFSFSLLCAYQMGQFGAHDQGEGFKAICASHSHVLPAESYDDAQADDARLREIALLQQRARSLEAEVVRREKMALELQEALRMRDDFLAVAGHELRTPLTPLSINLEALTRVNAAGSSEAELRERVARYAESTRRQLGRLSNLVTDMLDVSKISSGQFLVERSRVDYVALIRAVADRFEHEARRARCSLLLTMPPSVEGRCDSVRFEQVLSNLLDNAIRYGAKRPVHLSLTATAAQVTVVVSDDGIGIPREHMTRIFERFERAVSSNSYGGLGLGLYITRTLIEALGGTVKAESEPGRGARFTVCLPR